jgi:endonuclease
MPQPVSESTKRQIIEMVKAGRSNLGIARRLNVTPGQVASIKAHVTMGTYDAQARRGGLESDTIDATTDAFEEQEEIDEAVGASFSLERDLEIAICDNLSQLEDGLILIDRQQDTRASGRTDIVAKDREGSLVVIELKAGTAADVALTQIVSYMKNIREKHSAKFIRGILVAYDFSPRLIDSADMIPNLELVKYSYNFTFQKIGQVSK